MADGGRLTQVMCESDGRFFVLWGNELYDAAFCIMIIAHLRTDMPYIKLKNKSLLLPVRVIQKQWIDKELFLILNKIQSGNYICLYRLKKL